MTRHVVLLISPSIWTTTRPCRCIPPWWVDECLCPSLHLVTVCAACTRITWIYNSMGSYYTKQRAICNHQRRYNSTYSLWCNREDDLLQRDPFCSRLYTGQYNPLYISRTHKKQWDAYCRCGIVCKDYNISGYTAVASVSTRNTANTAARIIRIHHRPPPNERRGTAPMHLMNRKV